jgi:N-methylhydantoinase A
MRYVGQGYEIGVPVASGPLGATASADMRIAFEREYRRLYGRLIPGLDVEVLSWTLALTVLDSQPTTAASPRFGAAHPGSAALPGKRRSAGLAAADGTATLFDPETGAAGPVPLYRRTTLEPGLQIAGPALVVEAQTTAVVPRGFTGWIDRQGHLVLERIREGA